MLDIKFIRENADLIKAGAAKKHIAVDLDKLLAVDEKRRALLAEVERMRAKQNEVSDSVVKAGAAEKENLISQMRTLKETLGAKEKELEEATREWQLLMVQVPNIPDPSVPEGGSDEQNMEVRAWGIKPEFTFTPKNHIELMQTHDMADFERGAKVSGFRGYFLKNDGARLVWALERFVIERFQNLSDVHPGGHPQRI